MARPRSVWLFPPALIAGSVAAEATTYLSVEAAQRALLPNQQLVRVEKRLTDSQAKAIEQQSGTRVREPLLAAWRTARGDWFLVDRVVGKHEFITYAMAVSAEGEVLGIEVLDYRETYGDEIREPNWRAQFVGKRADDPIKLGSSIRNISGATLSCRHVTDGVRRLLATHAIALR